MSFSPVRLNHAVLFVADLERAERFYTEVFGMVVAARETRANAAFLRLPRSGNHHDLGLFGVGSTAPPKHRGGIGLYHLAWQLDTIEELAAARQALVEAGAYTGESSHGATKSIYGADPDGNEFEIMWMLPRDAWGEFENAAPVERLELDAEVARWAGTRTAGRIVADARATDQDPTPPALDPEAPVIVSRADVATESPDRYAKQLIAHLGRKLHFDTDGATATTTIAAATGQIVVGDGLLTLIATGVDAEAVGRVEQVLGSHLERFGQRNELVVTWMRGTTSPASRTGTASQEPGHPQRPRG